jgi:hypothetical protein
VFFARPRNEEVRVSDDQRRVILRWFWRACMSRRYSSGVLRSLKTDIQEMMKLRRGEPHALGEFAVSISPDFFNDNTFIATSVNTRTFVLLLAQHQPLSFVSGQPIDLGRVLKDYNRNEFHHLYPRAFLRDQVSGSQINQLANFAFLSRADNRQLGGTAPSQYKASMATGSLDEILDRAFVPASLLEDDFERFIAERTDLLVAEARRLVA